MEVVFVCWGNICRSPMAERVARAHLDRAGLGHVQVSSAGTSREELGSGIDPRAVAILDAAGYRSTGHRARQIDAATIERADLVVAMEDIHVDRMRYMTGKDNPNVVLLRSFDPDAEEGAGVPDPWYGTADGFGDTLDSIEAAMPGLLARVRELDEGELDEGGRDESP